MKTSSFSFLYYKCKYKQETIQHSFLFCFDLGAEEGWHRFHAGLVHLSQSFLRSRHLLGGLEKGGVDQYDNSMTLHRDSREFITHREPKFKLRKNTFVQGKPHWPMCIKSTKLIYRQIRYRQSLKKAVSKQELDQQSLKVSKGGGKKKKEKNMIQANKQPLKIFSFAVIIPWSFQADCSDTHFPRKVCTVEFGVVLSSLHWYVWKFPLLPNEEVREAFHDKEHQRNNTHH